MRWVYLIVCCAMIGFLVAAVARGIDFMIPRAWGYVVAYIVISIGGYCAYKFFKECAKL